MNSKTFASALLLAFTGLCLSGCVSGFKLPEVAGKSVLYSRTDTFGGTSIEAQNVAVSKEKVTADSVHWVTQYPQFRIELKVEGYERKRDAKE